MDHRYGKVQWGPSGTRSRTSASYWRKPHQWNKQAANDGQRIRVFCASLADVFEDRDELIPWRADLFALIDETPNLDWQLLTKRPENIPQMMPRFMPNVWLGTSVENQEMADLRIHRLYHGCRHLSPVLFLSAEPLLGHVKIHHDYDGGKVRNWFGENGIDWVIVGGESGHGARPFNIEWARTIIEQCRAGGAACFVKQLGAVPYMDGSNGERFDWPCGYEVRGMKTWLSLKDKKGGDWDEWPEDLRVREMPLTTGVES